MSVTDAAVHQDYFDRLYEADPDPWRFKTSIYERAKYSVTLAALAANHFSSGLEVGCSIGVLTRRLAPLCENLLGVDLSSTPLVQARLNCFDHPHVNFRQARVPDEWPTGRYDLVILSEVLYFLGPENIAVTADRLRRTLLSGGTVVSVNWLGPTGTVCGGDGAANLLCQAASDFLVRRLHLQMPKYRVDVFTSRKDAASIG